MKINTLMHVHTGYFEIKQRVQCADKVFSAHLGIYIDFHGFLCLEITNLNNTLLFPGVSPLSCVSCVPASCFHIWFVSCPRLMWSLVNSCPAVFVSLSMIYLCIYSPVCSVRCCLVYSLLPVFPVYVSLALSCLALMSSLKTIIWV